MARRPLLVGLVLFSGILIFFFLLVYMSARLGGEGLISVGVGERIALIRIEGTILDAHDTIEDLHRYAKDRSVRAVLLRIDSPGGAVVPSQEIYQELKKIRDDGKTVVVSMGSIAASGGYYIAAASDKIVANPGTITGSIGVIMELANVQGLLEKIGVESTVIKSGKHKDLASPFRKMTEQERALIQGVLDDVHDQFIQAVAEGRSLEVSEVRKLADGRIFTGRQAKDRGLVDELGGLEDAVRITGEMIGARGEPRVIEPRRRSSIFDLLREQFWGGFQSRSLPFEVMRLSYLLSI